jgi:molecular chaperone GrpE
MTSETSNDKRESKNEPVGIPIEDSTEGELGQDLDLNRRLHELEAQLKQEQEKAKDYLNRLRYLQADIDNLQKKTRRELDSYKELANERLLLKIVGIEEDLERAQEIAPKESPPELMEGLNMILDRLRNIFREEGLEEIKAVGRKFDPLYHEVVSFSPSKDLEDGTIISEIRKGYILNGRVIRTSMVEVARKPEESATKSDAGKQVDQKSESEKEV